jgi:serine protease Do
MPRGGVMTGQAAATMMAMEPHTGVKLAAITEADRKQYGLSPVLTGVLITEVEPDCEVSGLGVVAGDVITVVQDMPVAAPDEVWSAVKAAHEQHQPYLAVLVQSKSGAQWLPISISR